MGARVPLDCNSQVKVRYITKAQFKCDEAAWKSVILAMVHNVSWPLLTAQSDGSFSTT